MTSAWQTQAGHMIDSPSDATGLWVYGSDTQQSRNGCVHCWAISSQNISRHFRADSRVCCHGTCMYSKQYKSQTLQRKTEKYNTTKISSHLFLQRKMSCLRCDLNSRASVFYIGRCSINWATEAAQLAEFKSRTCILQTQTECLNIQVTLVWNWLHDLGWGA